MHSTNIIDTLRCLTPVYLWNMASSLVDLHLIDTTSVRCQAASNIVVIINLLHNIADLVCYDLGKSAGILPVAEICRLIRFISLDLFRACSRGSCGWSQAGHKGMEILSTWPIGKKDIKPPNVNTSDENQRQ
jgi:hypothetical protein